MKHADKIRQLAGKCKTVKEIAEELNLSVQTVRNIACANGIRMSYDATSRWGVPRKSPTKSFSITMDLALSNELDAMKARGEIKSKSRYLEELARERLNEHR